MMFLVVHLNSSQDFHDLEIDTNEALKRLTLGVLEKSESAKTFSLRREAINDVELHVEKMCMYDGQRETTD